MGETASGCSAPGSSELPRALKAPWRNDNWFWLSANSPAAIGGLLGKAGHATRCGVSLARVSSPDFLNDHWGRPRHSLDSVDWSNPKSRRSGPQRDSVRLHPGNQQSAAVDFREVSPFCYISDCLKTAVHFFIRVR
jgi:hypothetical protein